MKSKFLISSALTALFFDVNAIYPFDHEGETPRSDINAAIVPESVIQSLKEAAAKNSKDPKRSGYFFTDSELNVGQVLFSSPDARSKNRAFYLKALESVFSKERSAAIAAYILDLEEEGLNNNEFVQSSLPSQQVPPPGTVATAPPEPDFTNLSGDFTIARYANGTPKLIETRRLDGTREKTREVYLSGKTKVETKYHLNGSTPTLKTDYLEDGTVIEKGSYSSSGVFITDISVTKDSSGIILSYNTHHSNGKVKLKTTRYVSGHTKSVEEFDFYGSQISKANYTEAGRLVSKQLYENGRLCKDQSFYNGILETELTYSTTTGHKISIVGYYTDTKTKKYETLYKNNVVSETTYFSKTKQKEKRVLFCKDGNTPNIEYRFFENGTIQIIKFARDGTTVIEHEQKEPNGDSINRIYGQRSNTVQYKKYDVLQKEEEVSLTGTVLSTTKFESGIKRYTDFIENGFTARRRTYSSNGNKDTFYNSNGTPCSEYTYFSNSEIIHIEQHFALSRALEKEKIYRLDKTLESESFFRSNGLYDKTIHYADNGRTLSAQTDYRYDGTRSTKTFYTNGVTVSAKLFFDEMGNKKTKYQEMDNYGEITLEETYRKNEALESKQIKQNGRWISVFETIRDTNGHIRKDSSYYLDGKTQTKCEYVNDKISKKTSYLSNGQLDMVWFFDTSEYVTLRYSYKNNVLNCIRDYNEKSEQYFEKDGKTKLYKDYFDSTSFSSLKTKELFFDTGVVYTRTKYSGIKKDTMEEFRPDTTLKFLTQYHRNGTHPQKISEYDEKGNFLRDHRFHKDGSIVKEDSRWDRFKYSIGW
jgi:antitoxin component YwqK of YwqJK toxin-antitoxin module